MKKIIFLFLIFVAANVFAQYKIDTVAYFVEKTDKYSIEVYIPKMYDAVNQEYAKDFNLQMEEMAKERKKYYQRMVKEITDDDIMPYQFHYSFEIVYSERDFISILFYSYEYLGGAHGITPLYSYNYDFYLRKIITLDDLFYGNYLKEISRICIDELKNMNISDDDWISEGASPKPENYSVYNFLEDGVVITFSQYQVGPYAIGTPQVYIELDRLKKYLKQF